MDNNIELLIHNKFMGYTYKLKRNKIGPFDITINDKPVTTEAGFQYNLSVEKDDLFKKTSWYFSEENDKNTTKENFADLLIEHLAILIARIFKK